VSMLDSAVSMLDEEEGGGGGVYFKGFTSNIGLVKKDGR
jgi:hypothetical protein